MIAFSPRTLRHVLQEIYPLEFPQTEGSTLGKMRTHVARWRLLTEDCPADLIDRQKLLEFRATCLAIDLEPSTINSHLRTVKTLAKLAGCTVSFERLMLDESDEPKPTPRLQDLDRIWRVTRQSQWPTTRKVNGRPLWCRCAPSLWWRAVLMLAFCTGLRRADLFGLTWDKVEADRIPTMNRKTKKPQYIPIAGPLQPWLNLLRRNHTARVLGPSDRAAQIDRELNRFASLVGLPELGLQGLRRASARAYERAHEGCGKLILNHGKTVTEQSYLDIEETLRDAQPKLVYPASFLQPPTLDRQRLMF